MKHATAALLFALTLAAHGEVLAHEGQDHRRIMGTVAETREDGIVVKTRDGKRIPIGVNDEMEYPGRDGSGVRQRPRVGDRVVVRAMGSGRELSADEIRFSPADPERGQDEETGYTHSGHRHTGMDDEDEPNTGY